MSSVWAGYPRKLKENLTWLFLFVSSDYVFGYCNTKVQKEPQEEFCKISYSNKFHNIHRKMLVLESLFNKVAWKFIKKRLQHRCFPVNISKFVRTPILKNICERILLQSSFVNNSHDLCFSTKTYGVHDACFCK